MSADPAATTPTTAIKAMRLHRTRIESTGVVVGSGAHPGPAPASCVATSDQFPIELGVALDAPVHLVTETLGRGGGLGVEALGPGAVASAQEPTQARHVLGPRGQAGRVDEVDATDRPAEAGPVVVDDSRRRRRTTADAG